MVREVWGSNPEPIKSPIRCQRLATVVTLIVWALAQSRGNGHRSLVTPERVLSEYNKDLIFFFVAKKIYYYNYEILQSVFQKIYTEKQIKQEENNSNNRDQINVNQRPLD